MPWNKVVVLNRHDAWCVPSVKDKTLRKQQRETEPNSRFCGEREHMTVNSSIRLRLNLNAVPTCFQLYEFNELAGKS